jgi:hypothetical protein
MAMNFQEELYCLWPKPIEFITFSALDTVFAVLFKSTVAPHHQLEPHLETLKIFLNIIVFKDLLAVLTMKPEWNRTDKWPKDVEGNKGARFQIIWLHVITFRQEIVSAQNKNYLSPTIDMVFNSQNGR